MIYREIDVNNALNQRKSYFQQRYQTKKEWYQTWYLQRKEKEQARQQQLVRELTTADNYKVLLSLKEYTELSQEKKQAWLNLVWTIQDLSKNGMVDIADIIKIREQSDNLIRDYYFTAKYREKDYNRNWNKLSEEQQQRLITKWVKEKVQQEKNTINLLSLDEAKLRKEKELIELAKFHEEKGKIKCQCWSCLRLII